MVRPYNSKRRKRVADGTRKSIVRAAVKLHWSGTTEFEKIADQAGCSLATVRKHFPTKEALYKDCTQVVIQALDLPDPRALAALADPPARLRQSLEELCRIHESMLGYAWHSGHARQHSETLERVMNDYEALTDAIAEVVAPAHTPKAPVVRGLLDYLTYRAMRLSAKLTPQTAKEALTATVAGVIGLAL